MGIFNTNQPLEEILEIMNNNQEVPETVHMGAIFADYNLRKELLDSQNEYNRKQLFYSRIVSLATIALVGATLLLM